MTDFSMPDRVSQLLGDYQAATETAKDSRLHLAQQLGELVGTQVDIVGYPDSATVLIDPASERRINVPVYSMMAKPDEITPRSASNCTIAAVDSDIMRVEFDALNPEDQLPRTVTGYTFKFGRILSIHPPSELL